MKNTIELTTIEEIFPESKFLLFRTFCKRKGIKYINQLTNEHLEEHAKRKHVGVGKINLIRQRLNQILHHETFQLKSETNIEIEQSNLPVNSIDNMFAATFFTTFREFCKKKNIQSVDELTDQHIQEYSQWPGVGEKKVKVVKEKVCEYLQIKLDKTLNIKQKTSDEDKLSIESDGNNEPAKELQATFEEIFPYNDFRTFWKYCKKNKIQFITEITEFHLSSYAKMVGVGPARVDAVRQRMELYDHLFQHTEKPRVHEQENKDSFNIIYSAGFKEIREIFQETKFNLFKRYCLKSGIKTLREITPHHIQKFGESRQVGQKRVDEVLTRLSDYMMDTAKTRVEPSEQHERLQDTRKQVNAEVPKFETGYLFELLKGHTIQSLFVYYGYDSHSTSQLKVSDIEGKDLVELADEFDPFLLNELINKLKIQKTPKEILSKLTAKFPSKELNILQNRYELGKTLEEVAKSFKLSRERIRQILNMLVKKVSTYLKRERFSNTVRLMSGFQSFISKEDLKQMVGTENKYIIDLLKQEKLLFSYFHNMDTFFLTDQKKIDLPRIEEFIRTLPDLFKKEEFIHLIQEELEAAGIINPSPDLVHNILDERDYKKYGEIYSRHKLATLDVITYLYKNYIQGPLRFDENSFIYLQDLAKIILEFELGNNIKSLENKLRNAETFLLVDSSTFEYFDDETIYKELIAEIEAYLDNEFIKRELMNVEELYEEFEESLKHLNINNKIHLYSIMKYFLSNKFTVGKGNTFNIYKKEMTKEISNKIVVPTTEEVIKAITRKFPTQVNKHEIHQFAKNYGYKDWHSSSLINRLILEGLLIEIDIDMLYNAKNFSFHSSTLVRLEALAAEKMGKKPYLSISNLKGYEHILPPVGFFWNAVLLKSFLERCGYRQIKKFRHDNRYDKVIVVKEDSLIDTFEDLVAHIILKHFNGQGLESDIYDFLVRKGILCEQANPDLMVLPQEIKTSKRFIFDTKGQVAVKK